jgi:heme/copper-type cytochrome/quinol oxidase subunit 4
MKSHATTLWLMLMSITGLSWWLVEHHAVPAHLATTAALLIAAFKARLVFLHFMELRSAPLPWRWVFEAWILLCFGVIAGGYWLAMR